MPSSEIDDLKVMAEAINAHLDPVRYQVNQCTVGNIDEMPQTFYVQRYTGPGAHWQTVMTGVRGAVRSYLNGILEGRCAALRRW